MLVEMRKHRKDGNEHNKMTLNSARAQSTQQPCRWSSTINSTDVMMMNWLVRGLSF